MAGGGEEGVEVFGGEGGELGGGDAAELGESCGGVGDECGLVALASVRDGCEEGCVGFDEDAVGRGEGGGFANGDGTGVGEVASEGEVEAGVEAALGLFDGAGEAVHDAGEVVWGPVLVDECEEVIPSCVGASEGFESGFGCGGGEFGGSAVDEDGLAGGGGDVHLGDEGFVLDGG